MVSGPWRKNEMLVPYRDHDLEQALCDICNKKPGWEKKAQGVCSRAMSRITDLENAWSSMREKMQEMQHAINGPDNSDWRN
jgi:hypothetical protein